MRIIVAVVLVAGLAALGWLLWPGAVPERVGVPMNGKVVKTDEEWREQLTDEQFHVTRQKGTERAFSGAYWNTKEDGLYLCVCCGQLLFDARTKFDSGTGWPSYWQPASADVITTKTDRGWLMVRTEVLCSRCDAHLGHVFTDGPPPTGLRYCMNSAALKKVSRSEFLGGPESGPKPSE